MKKTPTPDTSLWSAEYERLHRAMNLGPGRRMVDDTLAGRALTKADVDQAERYQRLMAATASLTFGTTPPSRP